MEPGESKSRKHFYISMVKSLIRIGATTCLAFAGIQMGEKLLIAAGLLLTWAEIFGIGEEL